MFIQKKEFVINIIIKLRPVSPIFPHTKILNQSLNFFFSQIRIIKKSEEISPYSIFSNLFIFLKDKQKEEVEMADIEPSIQLESFPNRINIFAITQILANINSLVTDLSIQPRLQNLFAAALTKEDN